jgi:hypothetical protein
MQQTTQKTKQKTISFRMDEQKSNALDTVAEYLGEGTESMY